MNCRKITRASTILLLVASMLVAADPTTVRKSTERPFVPQQLIIVVEEYPGDRRLQHAVTSAVALAKELLAIGHGVTLLTTKESSQKASEALGTNASVTLETVNTASEVLSRVAAWKETHFGRGAKAAPFGFVFLLGHGENRRDNAKSFARDYLLLPDDLSGSGGVCVQDLTRLFGAEALPVSFVVDMCRLATYDLEPEKPAQIAGHYGKHPSQYDDLIAPRQVITFSRGRSDVSHPVLTLWATMPGKAAYDGGNFTLGLAQGLKRVGKSFVARDARESNRNVPAVFFSPLEGPEDLSLFTWFTSAALYVHLANGQQAEMSSGLVDPMMIIASTRRDHIYGAPPLDMLQYWDQFTPTNLETEVGEHGVRITRPEGATQPPLFTVSFFRDQQFPWQQRSLIVDATAECPGKPDVKSVGCLIMPGDNSGLVNLNSKWQTQRYDVPIGKPGRFVIPLSGQPTDQFRSLGISLQPTALQQWPEGASIRITGLVILDQATGEVLTKATTVPETPVSLLRHWWPVESIAPAESPKNTASFVRTDGSKRLLAVKLPALDSHGAGGIGGSLYRPPYVDMERTQLSITIQTVKPVGANAAAEVQAELVIKDEADNMLVAKLPTRSGSKTVTFDFLRSGFPQRMYIMATNAAEIRVADISLVPKERVVRRDRR